MSATNILPVEDDVLAFTHTQRVRLLESMTKTGMPVDTADQKTMLTLLKDMDGAALSRKRIKVDEKLGAGAAQTAAIIEAVLAGAAKHMAYKSSAPVERSIPALGSDVPEPVVVPGETSEVTMQQEAVVRAHQETEES